MLIYSCDTLVDIWDPGFSVLVEFKRNSSRRAFYVHKIQCSNRDHVWEHPYLSALCCQQRWASCMWYFKLHYTIPGSIPKNAVENQEHSNEIILKVVKTVSASNCLYWQSWTSLYHWTLTRWLFLKTKIWCIIHFSLKLKVKCEYSFFFFFLALPWKKKNVAGTANKVLKSINYYHH